jgi:hypothetical protein
MDDIKKALNQFYMGESPENAMAKITYVSKEGDIIEYSDVLFKIL